MRDLAVVVPVKSAGKKSRLSGVLERPGREELARLLLSGVLDAVEKAGLLAACYVVSPDEEVLRLAALAGACGVNETKDRGVNSAVLRGMRASEPSDRVLVLPADLPLLEASELARLVRRGSQEVVISPSAGFDGTNALLFPRRSPVPLSYDDRSFWNHVASAARSGSRVRVCTEPGLLFDVDTQGDLSALARGPSRAPSAEFARKMIT